MVPRVEMICVSIDTPMEDILEVMAREKLSRVPVYEQTIDTIVGVIHIKNVMNFWRKAVHDMSAVEFISLPYFVPETKKVQELLREFQANRQQMAIVVDEYGGTAGLVTLEDVIEEIVGEITDEYDKREPGIHRQDDGSYLLDSKVEINRLNEELHLDLPSAEYHTIGGFVLWILRRMPRKNEVVRYQNLKLTVTEADRKRIHKVVLHISPAATA
jgi:CBS domain containing-hemolysin-like protein